MYQTFSQMARVIANRRTEDTGHSAITNEWKRVAKELTKVAREGALSYVQEEEIKLIGAPELAVVVAGVGFEEAANAAEAGATVGEEIRAEEIISILGIILLLEGLEMSVVS